MASFTGVGDNVTLNVPKRGENVLVSISGTYNMVIELQKKVGDGAWKTIPAKTYSTENATVADYYTTTDFDETLRLIVTTDTSGTATATLTDASDALLSEGPDGVLKVYQSGVQVRKRTVVLDQATYSAEEMKALANCRLLLSRSGGIDMTMPAATGSGDEWEFIVAVATTDLYSISADANGADFNGTIMGKADTVTTVERYTAGASNDILAIGGTSNAQGGVVGDHLVVIDLAANEYFAFGQITNAGTETTPFSGS